MIQAVAALFASTIPHRFFLDGGSEAMDCMFSLSTDVKKAFVEASPSCGCCEKRGVGDALVWTNFLMLWPAYWYLQAEMVIAASCVLFSLLASALYHMHSEKVDLYLVFDKVGAILGFFTTVPQIVPGLPIWGVLFAVFIVTLAFYFKKHQDHNYDLYHSLWHVSIFIGQLFLSFHV